MNRPIKFRVWDNKNKIWLDKTDFCIYNGDAQEVEIGGTEYLSNGVSCNPLKFVGDDTGGLYYNSNLIIQQYTGLNDSNDDPIYEGDILKIHYDVGGDVIGQVLYEADHGGYIFQWKRKGRNQDYNNLNCDVAFESVIVGNIFEHSELLK
jgi:uncharacterized phage protein (TIGR01671 family)